MLGQEIVTFIHKAGSLNHLARVWMLVSFIKQRVGEVRAKVEGHKVLQIFPGFCQGGYVNFFFLAVIHRWAESGCFL